MLAALAAALTAALKAALAAALAALAASRLSPLPPPSLPLFPLQLLVDCCFFCHCRCRRRHFCYSCRRRLCHRTIAVAVATAIIVATTYVKTVAAATDASAAAIVATFSTAAFS